VEAHCRHLARADLILVFHPNWWGQPPAILKGWIDRVFRPGVAYDYPASAGPESAVTGLLRAKAALAILSKDYGRSAFSACAESSASSVLSTDRCRPARRSSVKPGLRRYGAWWTGILRGSESGIRR
jgi:putative NADPH-quinone reductase